MHAKFNEKQNHAAYQFLNFLRCSGMTISHPKKASKFENKIVIEEANFSNNNFRRGQVFKQYF